MKTKRKTLTDLGATELRQSLRDTERLVGPDSESASILRRALKHKLAKTRRRAALHIAPEVEAHR